MKTKRSCSWREPRNVELVFGCLICGVTFATSSHAGRFYFCIATGARSLPHRHDVKRSALVSGLKQETKKSRFVHGGARARAGERRPSRFSRARAFRGARGSRLTQSRHRGGAFKYAGVLPRAREHGPRIALCVGGFPPGRARSTIAHQVGRDRIAY